MTEPVPAWHRRQADRLILDVHVQPGAARSEVAGLHGARLKIRLAALAVEGEANAELLAFIARRLGVSRRSVTIEAGLKSRSKRVTVAGSTLRPEALLEGG